MSPVFYAKSKCSKIYRKVNSRSVVEKAVMEYNSGVSPDLAASPTNSALVGSYVALRSSGGVLLAEIPLDVQEKVASFDDWFSSIKSRAYAALRRFAPLDNLKSPYSGGIKQPIPYELVIKFLASQGKDITNASEKNSYLGDQVAIIRDPQAVQIAHVSFDRNGEEYSFKLK